jgi:ankyrin repeat protein
MSASPILQALYAGKPEEVALLLEATPVLDLFEAAALGRTDRVRALLDENSAQIGTRAGDGYTALHLAAFFGHVETARLLVERGADVSATSENTMGVQPLHSAAATRHFAVAELLLIAGADADARQQGGWTPLQAAAHNGDVPLLELLLIHGADRTLAAEDGRTALDLAAAKGHARIAEILKAP